MALACAANDWTLAVASAAGATWASPGRVTLGLTLTLTLALTLTLGLTLTLTLTPTLPLPLTLGVHVDGLGPDMGGRDHRRTVHYP